MSSIDHSSAARFGDRYSLPLNALQHAFLWLLIAASWVVAIEPAPYEFLFLVTFCLFLPRSLSVTKVMAPLIVFLLFYNIGGILSVMPHLNSPEAVRFVATSCYMAVTGLFFAFACSKAPQSIIPTIRNAYIFAALLAAISGLIGYFNIAGMGELWALAGRAKGMFKDPNVFGTYLILPVLFLVHGLITGTQRWWPLAFAVLLVMLAGNFFAFSRGAWLAMFMSIVLAMGLTFIITPSLAVRSRIVLCAVAGCILIVVLVVFALSFDEIRDMFNERAKLIQPYDGGETGRFVRQLNAIPLLVESPNGLGPNVFSEIFGEDPHNAYLNAFLSYGWFGGLSYLLLVAATILAGWRAVFTRSPWQSYAVVVFSALFIAILQGLVIDTDHWRHFYLQLGLLWGLYAATQNYRNSGSG